MHSPTRDLTRVKELFIMLYKAHLWIDQHPTQTAACDGLVHRSEPIFTELEIHGVPKLFSKALLIFGAPVTKELSSQFKEVSI